MLVKLDCAKNVYCVMFNVPTERRSKYGAVDSCSTPDGSESWARLKYAGNAQLKRAGALPASAEQTRALSGCWALGSFA